MEPILYMFLTFLLGIGGGILLERYKSRQAQLKKEEELIFEIMNELLKSKMNIPKLRKIAFKIRSKEYFHYARLIFKLNEPVKETIRLFLLGYTAELLNKPLFDELETNKKNKEAKNEEIKKRKKS